MCILVATPGGISYYTPSDTGPLTPDAGLSFPETSSPPASATGQRSSFFSSIKLDELTFTGQRPTSFCVPLVPQEYNRILLHDSAKEVVHDEDNSNTRAIVYSPPHVLSRQVRFCAAKQILESTAVLFSPLSAHSLRRLLNVTEGIDHELEDLQSIQDIPNEETWPLRLRHLLYRDSLINNDDLDIYIDKKQAHWALADNCIKLMSASLERDICGVNTPGALVADIESSRVEQCLPSEVQYACLHWAQHLQKGGFRLCDDGQVHQFLQTHLLHWLEALSWMRKIYEGIHMITFLESITLVTKLTLRYEHD